MATIARCMIMIALLSGLAQQAAAQQVTLPFTGRLVDDQGQVITGDVDLQVGFFRTDTGGEAVAVPVQNFPHTTLDGGVFHINVEVHESDIKTLFPLASSVAFLEVKDRTHDRTYRRHPVAMTDLTVLKGAVAAPPPPAAVVAPVAPAAAPGAPSAAVALSVNDAAGLAAAGACLGVAANGAKFTVRSSDKTQPCQATCAAVKTGAQCLRGWTLFVNSQLFEFGNECGAVQITPSLPAEGHICCCVSQSSPEGVHL